MASDPNILGKQLLIIGLNLAKKIVPTLVNIITEIGIKKLGEAFTFPNECVSNKRILELITLRNNILKPLNAASKTIKPLTELIPKVSNTASTINTALTSLDITIKLIEANLASGTPPVAPSPVVSSLSIAKTAIENTKPILVNTNLTITSLELVIPQVYNIITKIIDMLNAIDLKLKDCKPNMKNNTLKPIDPFLLKIYDQQKQQEIKNKTPILFNKADTTYNGFQLSAITGSYSAGPTSPKIPQLKGIGKNAGGITILETEWSFTTDPTPLIEELKFKINKEQLKAY
jgi:hypothetical protein